MAFDHAKQLIYEIERTFWTTEDNKLPQITISQTKNDNGGIYFTFSLKDGSGQPIANVPIQWTVFDAFSWKEKEGTCTTEKDGICSVRRSSFSWVQLVGAKYDYQCGGFKNKITDLYISCVELKKLP